MRRAASELALGIASGDERANALEHVASCPDCRAVLSEHATLADELVLLAPLHEPPAGFESRVIERLSTEAAERRRRPRSTARRLWAGKRLRTALALVAVAAATAGVMFGALRDDHRDASRYRDSLAAVGGEYFDTASLEEAGGGSAGNVLAYQGSPSWLIVKVKPAYRSESYKCELITRSGRRVRMPSFKLDAANGTWSQAMPVALRDVEEVRVFDGDHEEALRARF
jgi:hypothetical protein